MWSYPFTLSLVYLLERRSPVVFELVSGNKYLIQESVFCKDRLYCHRISMIMLSNFHDSVFEILPKNNLLWIFFFFFKLHIHFYLFFEFSVLWSEHFLKTQFEGDV